MSIPHFCNPLQRFFDNATEIFDFKDSEPSTKSENTFLLNLTSLIARVHLDVAIGCEMGLKTFEFYEK
jgi:hypothetical protein